MGVIFRQCHSKPWDFTIITAITRSLSTHMCPPQCQTQQEVTVAWATQGSYSIMFTETHMEVSLSLESSLCQKSCAHEFVFINQQGKPYFIFRAFCFQRLLIKGLTSQYASRRPITQGFRQ